MKARAKHLLVFFLVLFLSFFVVSLASAQSAETTYHEKEGPVLSEERETMSALNARGILTPDSVVVLKGTEGSAHGYVDHMISPPTVHLTTNRTRYPDAEIPREHPYLFGRTHLPSKEIFRRYVIVHETAHVQSSMLNAEMGRPALGLRPNTDETQADILALVYMDLLYDINAEDLGYPEQIEYDFIPNKSVTALKRQYCYIVKKTWSVRKLNCSHN